MSGDHNMNQKPVAWFHAEKYKTHFTTDPSEDMIGRYWQPLYTAPQSINDFKPDWDTVKAFDDRHNEDTAEIERLTKLCYEYLGELTALRAVEQMREQRQPLTDDEIDDIWNRYCDEMGEASINDAYDIARAIEAAHGIGEKK
jgi:hypothetical protein